MLVWQRTQLTAQCTGADALWRFACHAMVRLMAYGSSYVHHELVVDAAQDTALYLTENVMIQQRM